MSTPSFLARDGASPADLSRSVPKHYKRTEAKGERALWNYGKQHRAIAWTQKMGLMLEPPVGGAQ